MPAAKLNLYIEAGASYSKTFAFTDTQDTPIDFTGYLFRGQVRQTPHSYDGYPFTCTYKDEDPTTGIITIAMTAIQTKAIPCGDSYKDSESQYVWSLEQYVDNPLADDAVVERVIEGVVQISPEVTQEVAPYA